jgi:KaiC/GvpD/RAD55 family RecA-like ATPase
LVSTGLESLDLILGGDGYPRKSAVLVFGNPDAGKEGLGYWFTQSGLTHGDFCIYLTRLPVWEVLEDVKGYGIDFSQKIPVWYASEGGQIKFDINDLTALSVKLKDVVRDNGSRMIRIVTDVLSPLLVLNPPETIYSFLSKLLAELKQYDAVLLATMEEGMHDMKTLSSMRQLFDGVIEFKLYEDGLKVLPLLRIRKMRGISIKPGYYDVSFTSKGMEVSPYAK